MIDTTIRQIGHPTMVLTDTDPKKSAAFSPNLHKYLKEKGHFFKDGGLLDGVYEVQSGTKAAEQFGAGTLLLGYLKGIRKSCGKGHKNTGQTCL